MGIDFNGRNVPLRINHIGINQEDMVGIQEKDDYKECHFRLMKLVKGKKHVIVVTDWLQPLSGFINLLHGYQLFLKNHPTEINNVCLLFFALPSAPDHFTMEEKFEII